MYYFVRPLNRDLSTTYFAKALVFWEFASYFPIRGSVAQLDRASDITSIKTMTYEENDIRTSAPNITDHPAIQHYITVK